MPQVTFQRVDLADFEGNLLDRVAALLETAPPGPVMIVGVERLMSDRARSERFLADLNLRRSDWPGLAPRAICFWVPRHVLGSVTTAAPDFFDWRSDTIDFPEVTQAQLRPMAPRAWSYGVDPSMTVEEQEVRMRELEARIAAAQHSDDTVVAHHRLAWWDELADLNFLRGEVDEALRIRTDEQLPVYERLGDVREKAVTNL